MGIDCSIITDKTKVELDRLSVFDRPYFVTEGVVYDTKVFIKLMDSRINDLRYELNWLIVARHYATKAKKVAIISENNYKMQEKEKL